jgi:cytidyltransferase-like protein
MIPIFPGRFQPLHYGHLWVIEQMISKYGKCIVAIVNPDPESTNYPDYETFHPVYNPFNYWERYIQIKTVLISRGLWQEVEIIPLAHPRYFAKEDKSFLPNDRIWYIPPLNINEVKKIVDFQKQGEKEKERGVRLPSY